MPEWPGLNVLRDAHLVGIARMGALEKAAQQFESGQIDAAKTMLREVQRFFDGGLERHFRHEEQALFPALARYIGRGGPIGAMQGEHDSLWRSVDELASAVDGLDRNADERATKTALEVVRVARHVAFLLRGHIEREDNMLFPLAERTLDERAKREVTENIVTIDRLAKDN